MTVSFIYQGGEININGEVLFYMVSGEAEISENGVQQAVKRGYLVKGADMNIRAQGKMMGLLVRIKN